MTDTTEGYHLTQGMPFEERYYRVAEGLRLLRRRILLISEIELAHRREGEERGKAFLEGLGEAARREMAPFVEKAGANAVTADERVLKDAWDNGVKLARLAFGADATEFAVKTIERESPAN